MVKLVGGVVTRDVGFYKHMKFSQLGKPLIPLIFPHALILSICLQFSSLVPLAYSHQINRAGPSHLISCLRCAPSIRHLAFLRSWTLTLL
jgi:hypothetical protein